MEITDQTLLLAFGLGLLGFIEPCTIGAHMLFLAGQRMRPMGQRISAAFIFLLARLVVMGGGYIAVEFAGVFNALGSKVTLVNRSDTILRNYEQGIVEKLPPIMAGRGMDLQFGAQIERVAKNDDGSLSPPTPGPGCKIFTRGWRLASLITSQTSSSI